MKREVILEKWRRWDYIDSLGVKIWLDRYGDICRMEDKNGVRIPYVGLLGLKGEQYLQTGYVWAPYVPVYETPLVSDIINASGIIDRYSKSKINSSYYVMCGVDVAKEFDRISEESNGLL
jgi:hypothetical protein